MEYILLVKKFLLRFKSISNRIPSILLFLHFDREFRCSPLSCFSFPRVSAPHIITRTRKSPWSVANTRETGIRYFAWVWIFILPTLRVKPSGDGTIRYENSRHFQVSSRGDEGSVSMHKLKPIRLSLIYSRPCLVDRIYTRNIPFRPPFGWMCHRAWLWVVASGRRAFPSM